MRTFRFTKLVPLLAAGALTFAVGCGDDDGDDDVQPTIDAADDTPDAPVPDAGVPDAAGPDAAVSTRSGTIALTDIKLVDSAAAEANWFRGAVVSVSYVPVPPVIAPDFSNLTGVGVGCSVTSFDLGGGEALPVQQDEGTITVGGAAVASPIGPCSLVAAANQYLCIAGAGATAAGDTFTQNADGTGGNVSNTAVITIAGGAFATSHIGMFVSTTGFTDPTAGAGDLDPYNGRFPIVAVPAATTIVVAFPSPAALPPGTTTGGTFTLISGAAPTPASVPFLTAGSMATVSKTAGTDTEAIADTMITVGTDVFRMDDATLGLMRQFPVASATPITMSCSGAGGTCGSGAGTVVSITATNADLTGAGPFDLPPGANMVSVSCREFGPSVTIPVEVLDVLEAITPTRIQTTMFNANFALAGDADGTNGTGMVAGYGYTKFGAPAASAK